MLDGWWMMCGRGEQTYGEDGEGLCVHTDGVLVEEGEVEGPGGIWGRGLCLDDHGGQDGGLEGRGGSSGASRADWREEARLGR